MNPDEWEGKVNAVIAAVLLGALFVYFAISLLS